MDHSSLRGEKIATRSKLRKRALELFVISDTFQQYRRQMVIDIAMKIGSIHLLNKEYEYSYSDYARVIIQLEKQKKLLSEKVDINGYYMAEMDRLAKAGRKG